MQTLTSKATRLVGDFVIVDGDMVSEDEARISIASSPMLYGLAAYTVLRISYSEKNDSYIGFRLRNHFTRLMNSAKIVGMEVDDELLNYQSFKKSLIKLLQANEVQEEVLVRCTLMTDGLIAGTKLQGLPTKLSMYAYTGPRFHSEKGINVCVSTWRRTPDICIPSRAKINGSYINATLMKNQALLEGYDDAIALDTNGHVSESSVANIFIVRDGKLITPDASSDILEGITRDTVMEWAQAHNIPVIERQIDLTELYIADEVFLSGTSVKITPVLTIDKRQIGDGKPGIITKAVLKSFDKLLVGEETLKSEWLTVL